MVVVGHFAPEKFIKQRPGPTPDTCTFDMCIREERVYENVFKLVASAVNPRFRVEEEDHDCPLGYRLAEDEVMQAPGFYGNVMHLREGMVGNPHLDSTLARVLRLEGSPDAEKIYFTDKGYFTVQEIIDYIIDFYRFHYLPQTKLHTEDGEYLEFGGIGQNEDGSYHISLIV